MALVLITMREIWRCFCMCNITNSVTRIFLIVLLGRLTSQQQQWCQQNSYSYSMKVGGAGQEASTHILIHTVTHGHLQNVLSFQPLLVLNLHWNWVVPIRQTFKNDQWGFGSCHRNMLPLLYLLSNTQQQVLLLQVQIHSDSLWWVLYGLCKIKNWKQC